MPFRSQVSPELDTSIQLGTTGIKKYQSLIGGLQWCVTLGRFDIACAVMTMGRFRTDPTPGHWNGLVQILGYLREHPDGAIRFRMELPDHEGMFKVQIEDWMKTDYGDYKEEIPNDAPKPKGKIHMHYYMGRCCFDSL